MGCKSGCEYVIYFRSADAALVSARYGIQISAEPFRNILRSENGNISGKITVESVKEFFRAKGSICLKADGLRQRVCARIGPRAGVDSDVLSGHAVQDLIYFIGYGTPETIFLRALPSQIAGPVILDGKSDVLHECFLFSLYALA